MLAHLFSSVLSAAERGRIPDTAIRIGIRRLLSQRAREAEALEGERGQERVREFIAACREAPIALATRVANEQHYELPAAFFQEVLGVHRKYSCGLWEDGTTSLDAAEAAALARTCERARLEDGQAVLELGCGWGSLSLWMAERYPASRITAVSNSSRQRAEILEQADRRGLRNLDVVTADVNEFVPDRTFDRVVSVEMFEHVRNQEALLRRIAGWLIPSGLLFLHIFCHRSLPYVFEDHGPQDWMTRHFFTGGMMPSDSLLLHYQSDLALRDQWRWSGTHYQKTCEAWLRRCDLRRSALLQLLGPVGGPDAAEMWLQRWRIFFMACAELFGYRQGREWWVSHYLFQKK